MKNIIGIFGVPRSGTSWLGQIFNSSPETKFYYQPMFTDQYRDRLNPRSSALEMKKFFQEMYDIEEDFLTQNDNRKKGKRLCFNKISSDYLVFKEVMYLYMIPRFMENLEKMKTIIILRNPFDILSSWYNAPQEFNPKWDIEKEWLFAEAKNYFLPERYYGYYKWKEFILLTNYLVDKFPEQVFVVKYEDLNTNPIECSQGMFEFCDLSWTSQTCQFIIDSRSYTEEDPYSVFKRSDENRNNLHILPETVINEVQLDIEKFDMCKRWGY